MPGNVSGGVQGLLIATRYRLGEIIGQGGMGRVWQAADEILDRRVAIKEMRIDDLDAEDSRIRRERTLREARATARIDHPNVVRVYDVVEEGDRLWIVMELVASRSLEKVLIEDGPLSPREAARVGMGLVAALREVHAVGVLHRDIKPGNVLLGPTGRIVLTDFGIAAIQDTTSLTVVGMLVGSPDYMAPERVGGRPQGPPSDLWSLGATLCAAVAGTSPFSRPTTLATLHAVLYEEPELPSAAGPLAPVLAALLVKEPERRPSLDAVYERLEPIAAPPTVRAPAPVPQDALPTQSAPTRPAPPPPQAAAEHPPSSQESSAPPQAQPGPQSQPRPGPSGDPTLTVRRTVPPPRAPSAPDSGTRRNRRRNRILVAATAAAAAAVAVVMILTSGDPGSGNSSKGSTSSPAPTVAGTSRPPTTTAAVPPGTQSETGFAWTPPKGWTRNAKSPSNVHYHSPDGLQETSGTYGLASGGDLMTQWIKAERGSHDVPGYKKIRLENTTFKDRPAIIWEYFFTQNGTSWKARQTGFDAGGKSYQVNIWYDASTETSALRTYDGVMSSFTPL
ncbi:protein kinase [Streptomyces sp. NPDC050738]|uniref:serine/threonine-protein kinase n=1 Tax=Streptomyces sp. NPDC050738 TaxID=3154744 RepID=UPI00341C2127